MFSIQLISLDQSQTRARTIKNYCIITKLIRVLVLKELLHQLDKTSFSPNRSLQMALNPLQLHQTDFVTLMFLLFKILLITIRTHQTYRASSQQASLTLTRINKFLIKKKTLQIQSQTFSQSKMDYQVMLNAKVVKAEQSVRLKKS